MMNLVVSRIPVGHYPRVLVASRNANQVIRLRWSVPRGLHWYSVCAVGICMVSMAAAKVCPTASLFVAAFVPQLLDGLANSTHH